MVLMNDRVKRLRWNCSIKASSAEAKGRKEKVKTLTQGWQSKHKSTRVTSQWKSRVKSYWKSTGSIFVAHLGSRFNENWHTANAIFRSYKNSWNCAEKSNQNCFSLSVYAVHRWLIQWWFVASRECFLSHDFSMLMRKIFIQHVKARELIGKRLGYCKIKDPPCFAHNSLKRQKLSSRWRSVGKVSAWENAKITTMILSYDDLICAKLQ